MINLTPRQNEYRIEIIEYIQRNGFPPTLRELADAMRVSVRAASDVVKALEKKGVLSTKPKKMRSIKVIDKEIEGIKFEDKITGEIVEAVQYHGGDWTPELHKIIKGYKSKNYGDHIAVYFIGGVITIWSGDFVVRRKGSRYIDVMRSDMFSDFYKLDNAAGEAGSR